MPFAIGDKVYLSTENLALPKGRSRKLMPKFIGPYMVTADHPQEVQIYAVLISRIEGTKDSSFIPCKQALSIQ
jgi:hypothetical protein